MSNIFTIPLPANYFEDELDYTDAELDAITDGIKATWGREPLPLGGGFDVTLRIPEDDEVSDVVKRGLCGFLGQLLKDAGVLSKRPAFMGMVIENGAPTPQAVVEMGMLMQPDGTPFVLPQEPPQCAA